MKKPALFLLVLILGLIMTGCDAVLDDDAPPENPEILRLRSDELGGEIIRPGEGNFYYETGSTAEIEVELMAGYELAGWRGDSDELAESGDNTWRINMDEDKELSPEFELIDFLLLQTEPVSEADDVPYNIDEIVLTYNNEIDREKLSEDIYLNHIDGNDSDNGQEDLINSIEVEANKITLSLGNETLVFGDEYQVDVSENIWDVDDNFAEATEFTFWIEKSEPGIPGIHNIRASDDGNVEILWESSQENIKDDSDQNAAEYRVYRSEEPEDNFEEIAELAADGDDNDFDRDNDLITYEDDEVDIDNTAVYYYKITAVNEEERESEKSEALSTEDIDS